MDKKVKIGNKEIKFTATAGTPRRYRNQFGHDLLVRIQENTELEDFELYENLAYIMSGETEKTPEEWLEQFSMTEFNEALEEIFQLWMDSQETTIESKK